MKSRYTQKGFTIIETLVAITILMISVAGPLTIAHKGLLAATYARDQVVASYLAQDAVEYIKNVKDNNIRAGRYWLTGFNGTSNGISCITNDTTSPNSFCSIDTLAGNPATPTGIAGYSVSCGANCDLYKDPNGGGYSHTSNGTAPQFNRSVYIVLKGPPTDLNARAVVVVTWKNGVINNQISYEAEMYNIAK